MGKYVARSFYELGIFVFLLCVTDVISSSNETNYIIDEIRHDKNLCQVQPFLYKNNITSVCHNVTYSASDPSSDSKFLNTFLCLAFYDTLYKHCQSNQEQHSFNDEATFYSYITKLNEGMSNIETFCDNIKTVKFSYAKLKPLLSHVKFNNSYLCYKICVDLVGNIVPLCEILAWSKHLDEIEQVTKNEQINNQNQQHDSKNEESQVLADKALYKVSQGNSGSTIKSIKATTSSNSTVITTSAQKIKTASDVDGKNKSSIPNSVLSKSEAVNEAKHASETLQLPSTNNEKPKDIKKDENIEIQVNEGIEKDINDANEDIKTSTISENTQDHENSANQDDWEAEKLPNDANDGLDQPIDAADQGQSIPEPSEQRDIISRYHNIRTDEESHFFTYFTIISLVSVAAYIGYHNKQKILAIVLEGRRSRSNRGRRRPSTANYRKLDCTLEEAVTSQCNANVTHVIY